MVRFLMVFEIVPRLSTYRVAKNIKKQQSTFNDAHKHIAHLISLISSQTRRKYFIRPSQSAIILYVNKFSKNPFNLMSIQN